LRKSSTPLAFKIVPVNVTAVPGVPTREVESKFTVKTMSANAVAENNPRATSRRPKVPTASFLLI
jgi:hypothetical protein